MKKMITLKRAFVSSIVLIMILAMLPSYAFAAVSSSGTPSEVKSLISSENLPHNYVKVSANGSSLIIECETPLEATEFNISVKKVGSSTSSQWIKRVYPSNNGDCYSFSDSISTGGFSGAYVLIITMKTPGNSNSIVFYKNCCFNVSSGNTTLLQYDKIMDANLSWQVTGNAYAKSNYTNKYLKDVKSLVFKNPKTGKVASVTAKKVNYFKSLSDKITAEASDDYEKALKIYEYVAGNFYYDNVAFQTKKNQYVDPYLNLYNLRNKVSSANSTKDGKVATTCVGYAAAVVALCRAQDIPARIVNGHHIGLSGVYNNWSTEDDITLMDHWWAEVYADGRWFVVDPTPGSSNKYDSKSDTWDYTGLTNYIYFDPSAEQLATSHETFEIKPSAYKVSKLTFTRDDKKTTVKATTGGKFTFVYDLNKTKVLKIVAKPNSGYKLKGIYNPAGKKISSASSYSFNPGNGTYTVKFVKA